MALRLFRIYLPGLQLQRTSLTDDGKRVRKVLLHILLHLGSKSRRMPLAVGATSEQSREKKTKARE